jgi:AraC family transcriptional regulator
MDPVQKALWFVESHLREPLALEDIARTCHVSAFHLTRAFSTTTGLSLMRYVRARRLSEAARRLARGADDILGVALDSGYGSTKRLRGPSAITSQRPLSNFALKGISTILNLWSRSS